MVIKVFCSAVDSFQICLPVEFLPSLDGKNSTAQQDWEANREVSEQWAFSAEEEEVAPDDQVDGVKTAWVWSCLQLRGNMSVDGTRLLLEGFLQKRKDTLVRLFVLFDSFELMSK